MKKDFFWKTIALMLIYCSMTYLPLQAQDQHPVESELVVLDVFTGKTDVVLKEKRHFEAPNWSRDGKFLAINADGKIEKISLNGEKIGVIPTGFANRCNNDHGFSVDGRTLIISHQDSSAVKGGSSRIFVVSANGGTPRLITKKFPSYWHGISPDGKWLVYCANRNQEWDIYKISIRGGEETRLTNAAGLDDGPEYSYDGRWIYFNSNRTGRMHLYRMKPDGTKQEQLTSDEYDNWFPHPSPNGNYLVYIAYLQDQKGQHPFGKDVKIRILDLTTGRAKDITPIFYGGQGSLNVHSWAPDGRRIAFVRYIRPSDSAM